MKSNIHFLHTQKTAIIYTLGNPENAENVWMILHGYGQLAKDFSSQFIHFDLNKNYLVFPEALHHFYLKQGKGDVGCSWMTKYEREKDIEDNHIYLNTVYFNYINPLLNKTKKYYVLGFSQGAATLIRWLALNEINPYRIILWGAVYPPDIEQERYLNKLVHLHWLYFIGSDDQYIPTEEKIKQKRFFESNKFNLQWIEYKGNHDIQPNLILKYISKK